MTRFHPIGRRPLDGGNADGAYCRVDTLDYMNQANDQRFVIVQIEDPEPLSDLDAIAALDGIDMIFFGPADFRHAVCGIFSTRGGGTSPRNCRKSLCE